MLSSLPPVTKALIVANVVVFLLQLATGHQLDMAFALWPPLSAGDFGSDDVGRFEVWQVVTYAFLHGSITHLLFNMLGLFMFGGEMERVWGPRRYSMYYLTCVIGAVGAEISGAACAATGTKVAAAATAIAAVPTLILVAIVFMDPPAVPPWKSLLASQTRPQPVNLYLHTS